MLKALLYFCICSLSDSGQFRTIAAVPWELWAKNCARSAKLPVGLFERCPIRQKSAPIIWRR